MLPTKRALELEAPARRALHELAAFGAPKAAFDPALLERTIVIATNDMGEIAVLPPLARRLAEVAPRVRLVGRPTEADVEGELGRGKIDLLVGKVDEGTARIRRRALFAERFVCLVRRDHPEVKKKLTLEQFAALRHVQVAPRGDLGGPVDAALARVGLSRVVAVRVANFLAGPVIVARSDMIITLPARVARVLEVGLGLRSFEPPLPVEGFTVSLAWHDAQHHDPAHAFVRKLLAEVAKEV
jgi:DNA-binding transcriptional LysR family regulator